jgi:hypothetical protein
MIEHALIPKRRAQESYSLLQTLTASFPKLDQSLIDKHIDPL